jgi:hypothetical protein
MIYGGSFLTQVRENVAVNDVKRADVLRQNTVKFKAVMRRFIVVSGRLRRRFRRFE